MEVEPYSRFVWANSVKVISPLLILDGPIIIDSRFRSRVLTGPLTVFLHCHFLGGRARAVAKTEKLKRPRRRRSSAIGLDGAAASAASSTTATRRRAASQRRL